MNIKYKRLLSDTIIFAIASIGTKLILFFLVPLYTNYLTEEQYGTAELIITICNLVVPILSIVIQDAILRYVLDKNVCKEDVLRIGFGIATVGSILSILITPFLLLVPVLKEWRWYICLYTILIIYNNVMFAYLKASGKNKLYACLQILTTLLMVGLNIAFLVGISLGVRGYILAYIISLLVVNLLALLLGKIPPDLVQSKHNKQLLKAMVLFSAPLIINNISWWVIQSSDKLMIEAMISVSALGLFTAASKIPSLVNVVTSIFSQAWNLSAITEFDESRDPNFYSNVFEIFSDCVCLIAILVILIIKPFMFIYVGHDFFESWQFVPLLILGAVFSALSSFFGTLYGAFKKSKNVMITTLVAAVFNIALNLVLIYYVGILGAVIATVISYFILFIVRLFNTRRYFKFNINWLRMILCLLLVTSQAIIATCDFYQFIVSLSILLVFCVLFSPKYFKKIKQFRRKKNEEEIKSN